MWIYSSFAWEMTHYKVKNKLHLVVLGNPRIGKAFFGLS
jgi:hypothetical protein